MPPLFFRQNTVLVRGCDYGRVFAPNPGLGVGGGSTPAGAHQVCGGREGVLHEGVGEKGPAAVGHVHRGHLHLLGGGDQKGVNGGWKMGVSVATPASWTETTFLH